MKIQTAIISMTLILAATVSSASMATDINDRPTSVVTFADLNVNTAAGAAALYRRIENASDRVCESARDSRQLKTAMDSKLCRAQATARAVYQVNRPALSALHMAKTRQTATPTRVARKD